MQQTFSVRVNEGRSSENPFSSVGKLLNMEGTAPDSADLRFLKISSEEFEGLLQEWRDAHEMFMRLKEEMRDCTVRTAERIQGFPGGQN